MKRTSVSTPYLLSGTAAAATMPTPPAAGPELPATRQVHPNSSIDNPTFTLTLPGSAHVRIVVHDLPGRQIRVLHEGTESAGIFNMPRDGRDATGIEVAPGIYAGVLIVKNRFVNSLKVMKAARRGRDRWTA